ncbi:hypothetical protein JCM10914A_02120 [Paenibacillus sp. JCM 10914]|uniref:hypothetical protein n=1 Tax=Paenibacillus sp. JCM 10914 TaxID=1236974 RepID=UPI0003CC4B6A|nr:hypothetical protein [Paenibacillus sp. JCM 10914]GAE06857.1 hypothetical protein JCM10914_3044 [Paenibacillus sp. JCM 10914]
MRRRILQQGLRVGALVLLAIVVTACQSQERLTVVESEGGTEQQPASNAGGETGERKLTVVDQPSGKAPRELVVNQARGIVSSNIEEWLSENEVRVTTIDMLKEATDTEEPEFRYTSEVVVLSTGKRRQLTNEESQRPEHLVQETLSPDGQHSFIQTWRDKYTADNAIQNLNTGELIPVTGDNYMQIGGWLDSNTYVLAAGSMNGKGDIRLIHVDGTYTTLDIDDEDVEYYTQFGASKGRIYYTDKHHVLKVVEPGLSKPVHLIDNVWSFEISPNSEYIAVSTATKSGGEQGSELLIYDAAGSLQGSLVGKGDLISYLSWAPDSSKLGFDVYTEKESGMNGVYVFDTASGKVSWMAPYYSTVHPAAHPTYPLSWSPSGKKLGITIDDEKALMVTQVIEFQS